MKKGFVTPTTMFGLERGERKKQHDVNHGVSFTQTAACVQQGAPGYLRGLCPGGVLFKFAVVDGEVGPVVTAVPQRSEAAVTTHTTVAIQTSQRRRVCLCQLYVPEQRFVLPEVQEFRDFNFLLAKVQLEAGETTFFRAMNPWVSKHGTFTFTPLYHRWNTCKTLLPWDLSYRLSQAN